MKVLFYYNDTEHIGIECLSSYLKTRGHEVDLVFDPCLGNNFFLNLPVLNKFCNDELIVKRAKSFNPDIIAFSCVTNMYPVIKRVAKKFKAALDVPIIIGGVHPTSIPEEVIREDCFDILCIGEGEDAFAELLERIEKNQSILKIKNLWVKDKDGRVYKNELRPLIKDLDDLPFADKSLFYKYGLIGSRIMVMTGRGCPFHCTFCVNNLRKGLYPDEQYVRRRSVDNVIEELIILKNRYNPASFRFEDDIFTYSLKWLKDFKIKYSKHIRIPFHCYAAPYAVSDPIVKELKLAGCASVSIGVQSGDEDIRTNLLHRDYSDRAIIEAARIIQKYRLRLITDFMFGLPTETPEQMWKSLKFNEKLGASNTFSSIFYPFPKTELTDYCLDNKYLSEEKYKLIKQGYGSYQLTCLLDHPYQGEIYKFKSILPIYTYSPRLFRPLLKRILKMKYGLIHKFLYFFSVPLFNIDNFFIRIAGIPKVIIKTRKVLNS